MNRTRLETLTERWRQRHDARQPAARPQADPEREAQASTNFPFQSVAPSEYVAQHGADMIGFTYDDVVYADPELDAWLREVGRLLREAR